MYKSVAHNKMFNINAISQHSECKYRKKKIENV